MRVREFLYTCRRAVYEIRSLERQRDAVRLPLGPSSGSTSIVAAGSKDNDPTATALNEMDYYDALLREKIAEQARKLVELEGYLGVLSDSTDRTIMRYYFGQGWTNARIADELEIEEETASRRRTGVVKRLERKFDIGKKSHGISGP